MTIQFTVIIISLDLRLTIIINYSRISQIFIMIMPLKATY